MQLPEIERLCRAVVPGEGSIELTALGAGLISETYRVVRDSNVYTLKIAAEHRPDLARDFPWEVRLLEVASGAGLAPGLVYCDLDSAVLLAQWAAGRSWSSHAPRDAANLEKIARLLRRVHCLAIPMPARRVTPLEWIELYTASLRRVSPLGNPELAGEADPALRREALARADALLQLPQPRGVVCHSDLHTLNLIQEGEGLILLDWEYAHVTDPFWDLAGWCANNDFEAELQWSLLRRYLGSEPISSQWQRFRSLLGLYDYVCLLWSRLYLHVRGDAAHPLAERARLLDARLRLPANYAV